jgi:hypothetical protein
MIIVGRLAKDKRTSGVENENKHKIRKPVSKAILMFSNKNMLLN